MKNVLFIVYYFPPMGGSGVQRPLKFAKYLKEYGWNPIILCPKPGAYQFFDETLVEEVKLAGLEVVRVDAKTPFHALGGASKQTGLITGKSANFLRKISRKIYFPDNKKGWIKPALNKAKELISSKNIELIYSTAPPFSNHVIGMELNKQFNIPLVVDYRDLFVGNHFDGTLSQKEHSKKKQLEQNWLRQTNGITVLDDYASNKIEEIEPSASPKIKVLPHGYDPADFETNQKPTLQYHQNKINWLYSGLFYESNQPDVFLSAWKSIIDDNPEVANKIHLHFQGGLDQRIKNLIKELGLELLVSDYGYVSHPVAVANLMSADILWMISNFDKKNKQIKSGKLFEYLGSKKPILALVHESKAASLIRNYGAGYSASPNLKEEIITVLKRILIDWDSNLIPKVNSALVENHNRKLLTKQLAQFFDQISAHSHIEKK